MAIPGQAVYAPMRHPETQCFEPDQVKRWYVDHIRSGSRIVFHHAPYDCGWVDAEWDVRPPEKLDDSLGMAFMLDADRLEYGLDAICESLGVPGKDQSLLEEAARAYRGVTAKKDIRKKMTEREVKGMLWRLPGRYVGPYAEQDVRSTLNIAEIMDPQIDVDGVRDAYQLEMDLVPMILEMRKRGIRVDIDQAEATRVNFLHQRDVYLGELSKLLMIGRQVSIKDINSRGFLEKAFTDAKIPFPRTAPSERHEKGQASFESDWMKKIDHPLPQLVYKAGRYHSSAEKFIKNYILGYTHMGRIHADIHQYKDESGGTKTYRFSYSDPPLQQMPSRDEEIAPLIRKLFKPEEGTYWFAPDYSQQEYRLIVHMASVCRMAGVEDAVRMYRENPNTDFHNLVVELTGLIRRRAKDVNFAKAFGAGVPKFALMTGMSLEEAKKTMSQYDEKMPFVSRLAEFCQGRAEHKGFLRLIDGARVRFNRWEPRYLSKPRWAEAQKRGWYACDRETAQKRIDEQGSPWFGERLRRAFCHKSMNWLIQGSAARQTKLAMREIWRMKILPLIQMHDELGIPVDNEAITKRIQEAMIDVVKLQVPVKVDNEFGPTWGEAKYSDWKELTEKYPLRMAA